MKKILILALFSLTTLTIVNAQVPSYVPTNGLVGWWPFNGNVNDQSVHAYTGTTYGSWNYTTDRFGNANSAFNFNSPSRVETNATGMFTRQKISISVWVNTADTNRSQWVTKCNWVNATNEMLGINQWTSNSIGFGFKNNSNCIPGSGWVGPLILGNYLSPNQWTHYVFVCDSLNAKIFRNGSQIGATTNVLGFDICNGGQLRFGAFWLNDPGYFKGVLDDIGIWNRALDSAEIASLYNANSTGYEKLISETLFVYPNPASTILTVNNNSVIKEANILSIDGRFIQKTILTAGKNSIDITSIENGIYILKVGDKVAKFSVVH